VELVVVVVCGKQHKVRGERICTRFLLDILPLSCRIYRGRDLVLLGERIEEVGLLRGSWAFALVSEVSVEPDGLVHEETDKRIHFCSHSQL